MIYDIHENVVIKSCPNKWLIVKRMEPEEAFARMDRGEGLYEEDESGCILGFDDAEDAKQYIRDNLGEVGDVIANRHPE